MELHREENTQCKKLDRLLLFGLAALVLVGGFLGIWSARNLYSEVPREVASVYQEYMERMKDGVNAQLLQDLCYFEDQFMLEAMLLSTDRITTYQVVGWRQLSNKLWAVVANVATDLDPSQRQIVNFIGLIDKEYCFIINTTQIPKNLKKDLPVDLQSYNDYMIEPEQYQQLISLILSIE